MKYEIQIINGTKRVTSSYVEFIRRRNLLSAFGIKHIWNIINDADEMFDVHLTYSKKHDKMSV